MAGQASTAELLAFLKDKLNAAVAERTTLDVRGACWVQQTSATQFDLLAMSSVVRFSPREQCINKRTSPL